MLKEDSRAIVRAASLASKASDFLLGHLGERGKAEAAETDSELQGTETGSDAEAA